MTGKTVLTARRASVIAPVFILWLAVGCGRALQSRAASLDGSDCTLVDSATERAHLPDGRLVFVDGGALVEQGGRYLLLGGGTFIDTGSLVRRASVKDVDAVGVLLDAHGQVTLIPMPPDTRHFEAPKILRADRTGADVLWLDPDSVDEIGPRPTRIMLARYAGGAWSRANTVANVERLLISRNVPSLPTKVAGGVAIPVSQFRTDSGTAVELLVEWNGVWSRRPVASGFQPLYPSLATLDGAWFLAFTGIDPVHGSGLFVTRSSDAGATWSPPYLLAAGRAYDERLFALGRGLALVWVGEHQNYRPRGVHVAFSRDGTHWTTSAAFDPVNDSTTAATAMPFDDSRMVLVRLIGESADRIESLDMASSALHDVLWTKPLTALSPPELVKHGSDAITLVTDGAHRSGSSITTYMTLSIERVHCE